MEPFKLQWRDSTQKDLRRLPRHEVERLIKAAVLLVDEPFPAGVQKLTGSERTYRIRVGDYRIIYEVLHEKRVVEIQRVRHRKDVYRA